MRSADFPSLCRHATAIHKGKQVVVISRPTPTRHQASAGFALPASTPPGPKVRSEQELQPRAAGNLTEQNRRIAAAAEATWRQAAEARKRAEEAARQRADQMAYELIMEEENNPKKSGVEEKNAKKKTKQGGVQSKEKKTGKPRTFDRDTEGEPPSSKALPIMAQQEDSPPTSNDGGSETSATEQPSGESAAPILREVGVLGRNTEHEGGDVYQELLAVGAGHISRRDWGRAIKVYRKAVAVRPEVADAHIALGGALFDSAHYAEAAHSFLEATERTPGGSEKWAAATSAAFEALRQTVGRSHGRSNKPEWWDDEGLKALSARVVNAAPSLEVANRMRAVVLSGLCSGAWEARPRSATELRLAALHFERCAELSPCKPAGPWKTTLASYAQWCISRANAM